MSELRALLARWDKGGVKSRCGILRAFAEQCPHATAPEIEAYFSNGGSLVLTRIGAWLRLTYSQGTAVALQLEALGIFLGAAGGQHFILEFVEVGGAHTVLELLLLDDVDAETKAKGLDLLGVVAKTGRRYKELLCKCETPLYVTRALRKLAPHNVQVAAKHVLSELCIGNPAHEEAVMGVLADSLGHLPNEGKITVSAVMDSALASTSKPSMSWLDPVLSLLHNTNLHVQYQGQRLLQWFARHSDIAHPVIISLIGMLQTLPAKTSAEEERARQEAEVLAFCTQSGAAKALSSLVEDQPPIAADIVELGGLQSILRMIGRTTNQREIQDQAVSTAKDLLEQCPAALGPVEEALGKELLMDLLGEGVYVRNGLSHTQANLFLNCTLKGLLV